MLDFIVGDDGVIVVSLDGEPMVRTVKMTLGGVGISLCGMNRNLFFLQLIETFDAYKMLIESLNFKGVLRGMSCAHTHE